MHNKPYPVSLKQWYKMNKKNQKKKRKRKTEQNKTKTVMSKNRSYNNMLFEDTRKQCNIL